MTHVSHSVDAADSRSLWSLSVDERAYVAFVADHDGDNICQRLADMGFLAGRSVTCLVTPGFGAPRVYAVGGSTYSIDKRTAELIRVVNERPA